MTSSYWQKKWLCQSKDGGTTFQAVEMEAKRVPDGWVINMRPGCSRSKFLEFVPEDKVYDTKEEAEAKV